MRLHGRFGHEAGPCGRAAFSIEAFAGDRLRGSLAGYGELRPRHPLPELLAERGEARHHDPGVQPSAHLVRQGAEDEGIEHDRVTARLAGLREFREGRDPSRLLPRLLRIELGEFRRTRNPVSARLEGHQGANRQVEVCPMVAALHAVRSRDRKSTRLNSSHSQISYAVFCLKKKKTYKSAHTNV